VVTVVTVVALGAPAESYNLTLTPSAQAASGIHNQKMNEQNPPVQVCRSAVARL
jgi:hypothetical protein